MNESENSSSGVPQILWNRFSVIKSAIVSSVIHSQNEMTTILNMRLFGCVHF